MNSDLGDKKERAESYPKPIKKQNEDRVTLLSRYVAQEGNRMLDKIRVGINKAYQEICDKDNYQRGWHSHSTK